jgi:predicted AlkP superfamily phosphohydrolase/phosphomutase
MAPVLVVGLDGATHYLLDRFMADGTMPVLGSLAQSGVQADLRSTANPLTPAAWASLMTGCDPGGHGIYDFVRIRNAEERPSYAIASFRDLQAETVWSIASRQGRRVTVLNFPVMFPPPTLYGCIVPGFIPPRHVARLSHPRELGAELTSIPGFDAKTLLLDLDVERESLQTLERAKYADWIRLHIAREKQWAAVARHVMKTRPAELTAVMFDGMDKIQHLCWRFLDPEFTSAEPSAWEAEIRALCIEYYRTVDTLVGELVAMADPGTTVFVASDHGFGPTTEVFYVNAWLAGRGLLQWSGQGSADQDGRQMTPGHWNPEVLFDWTKTTAYALTAGSNGIYVRVAQHPGAVGVDPADYDGFCRWLADELLAFRDPSDGNPVVVAARHRSEAFPGPFSSQAPDLTLTLRDGGFISILESDQLVRPRPEVMGTHRPHGIFIANGAGVVGRGRVAEIRLTDITPMLLSALGLPIPEGLDGRLPPEVLRADQPALAAVDPEANFCEAVPVGLGGDESADTTYASYEDQQIVLARLNALGYIETD